MYLEDRLNDERVEITEDDFDFAEEKVKQGKSIEDACDEVLRGIRECLDDGLED